MDTQACLHAFEDLNGVDFCAPWPTFQLRVGIKAFGSCLVTPALIAHAACSFKRS